MLVPDTGVNNTNLDTLAKNALSVKLGYTSGIVRGVGGSVLRCGGLGLGRSKLDLLVDPHVKDVGKLLQGVEGESVRLDAGAGEDIAGKLLDDLDAVGGRDILTTKASTGTLLLRDGECQLGTTSVGKGFLSGGSP